MKNALRLSVPVLFSVLAFGASAPLAFAAAPGDVVINEFVSNPSSGSDWVELYNTTGSGIDISGWKIQDLTFSSPPTPSGTATTTVGASTNLPAHGFLVVNITTGGLNAGGDVAALFDSSNTRINQVSYGAVTGYTKDVDAPPSNNSAYRTTNGGSTWAITASPTKGTTNVPASNPSPVVLGTAGNFVILTYAGITDTPTSIITGNIGAYPISGTGIGVPCPEVTGTIYKSDAGGPSCYVTDATSLSTAIDAIGAAITDANGRAATVTNAGSAGEIGGLVLAPGVYTFNGGSSNVTISTDLTLSGGANDVWIFQIPGTFDVHAKVILGGEAQAKNIFWSVTGATTLFPSSVVNGTILDAGTGIAMQSLATLNGRALATPGSVTLDHNTITAPPSGPIISAPTVTSVVASTGSTAGGTSVTITGSGFTGATAVKFGSTPATSFNANSGTSITATSPAGTGTVDVTVITSGGTSATGSADQFAYAPCLGAIGSPLVVDVTQQISNDPDSGVQGNYWALDDYARHIQVWLDSGTTYCAQVDYNGTFHAPAGVLSPQNGNLIRESVDGTMIGGYRASIVGTLLASSTIPTTVNYLGDLSTGLAPGRVSWLDHAFNPEYVFNDGTEVWSWTYATPNDGTWVNASTGNSGDILSSSVFVATPANGGSDSNNGSADHPFATIQAAISAVSADGTINVAAGTYTEVGQIVINKNLNIVGIDKATTIIKPAQDTGSSGDARGWFLVNAGTTFNLSDVTLDGTGHLIYMGLYYWGNGTVNNCNISNIKYNESGPDYMGRGMIIKGNVDVINSTFTQMGRIGIQYYGGSGTASGNTFVGKGAGNWLDYAFDIDNGAVVNVQDNTVSNNIGVASVDGSTSAAVMVTTFFGPGTKATVTGNILTNNSIGIAVGFDGSDTSAVVAHDNLISGNTDGVVSTNPIVNATNNWWGNASGPTNATTSPSGTGDSITDNVTFKPWYANATMATLSYGTTANATYTSSTVGQADLPAGVTGVVLTNGTALDLSSATTTMTSTDVTVGDNTVTLTQSVVLQSGIDTQPVVLTNSSVPGVTVSIPDGTIIQGPDGWDGTIVPPTTGSSAGEAAPSGFTVGNTIDVGSPSVTLVFNSPVTIVLTGVTGAVGYKPAESNTWVQITNVCGGTYDAPTPPTAPGECAISNGTDTKIVTYHFTSFGGLDPIPTPTPTPTPASVVVNNGALSFVGGGGGYANPLPGATIPTGVTNTLAVNTETSNQGQVLGAAVYNFTTNLTVGSNGADVTALQQFLIGSGYSISAGATGYFGSQTLAAVIAYQKANALPTTGYVGPLTLALLNKGTIPTTTAENSNSGLSVGQASAIIGLLEAFGADQTALARVRAILGL